MLIVTHAALFARRLQLVETALPKSGSSVDKKM